MIFNLHFLQVRGLLSWVAKTKLKMQLLIAVLCLAFVYVSSESSEESRKCPQFHNQAGVTLFNLTGSPLYMKYSKTFHNYRGLDAAGFKFTKVEGTDNKYLVKHVTFEDEEKEVLEFDWTEFPSKQEVLMGDEDVISFAIPYYEKDKAAVVYICEEKELIQDKPVTTVMVLTTSLENDLTKAVEEGKKLIGGQDFHELPFKHKDQIIL